MLKEFSPEVLKAAYSEKGLVQDNPANMWTFQMVIIVREDMPEDVAYEITKQFWENLRSSKAPQKGLKTMSEDLSKKDTFGKFRHYIGTLMCVFLTCFTIYTIVLGQFTAQV